jgi:flagellar biosynthesis protein FlhB
MSEAPDKESKTEVPTERRLSEAVEKGNTPFSREAVSLGSLLAILLALQTLLPSLAQNLLQGLASRFGALEQFSLATGADVTRHLSAHLLLLFAVLAPCLLLVALGGIAGSLAQNSPSAVAERVMPKWERLSPANNFKRIMGREALVEAAKLLVKFAVLVGVAYFVLRSRIMQALTAGFQDPRSVPEELRHASAQILGAVTAAILVLAVVDMIWTRLKWWNDLRMTRQEQKEEFKNSEGDPLFKGRRRMLAQKRLKTRMLADMPRATFVVANPTHFAVALRYVPAEGGAPLVIAKGLDHLALKIREISGEHAIPVVENKPLARSLYGSCEVGSMIPPEHFRAVAEVIHFIERRKSLASSRRTSSSRL